MYLEPLDSLDLEDFAVHIRGNQRGEPDVDAGATTSNRSSDYQFSVVFNNPERATKATPYVVSRSDLVLVEIPLDFHGLPT